MRKIIKISELRRIIKEEIRRSNKMITEATRDPRNMLSDLKEMPVGDSIQFQASWHDLGPGEWGNAEIVKTEKYKFDLIRPETPQARPPRGASDEEWEAYESACENLGSDPVLVGVRAHEIVDYVTSEAGEFAY